MIPFLRQSVQKWMLQAWAKVDPIFFCIRYIDIYASYNILLYRLFPKLTTYSWKLFSWVSITTENVCKHLCRCIEDAHLSITWLWRSSLCNPQSADSLHRMQWNCSKLSRQLGKQRKLKQWVDKSVHLGNCQKCSQESI